MTDRDVPITCVCATVCFSTDIELAILRDRRHHPVCPMHKTEKHPRLFYYEEAVGCWTPAPDQVDGIIETSLLDDGERIEIRFKRVDMTDEEYANLEEV